MQEHKLFYEGILPHYQPTESTFLLSNRIYGSMPLSVLQLLKKEYHALKCQAGIPYNVLRQLQIDYFIKFDEELEKQSKSPRWLIQEGIAQLIYDSLLFNHEKQYKLWSFTIMPNHIHALLSLLENSLPLYSIMQRHKRYTARQCNKLLARSGHFWEPETYDRVIRDPGEFEFFLRYILNNPLRAGLVNTWSDWKWTFVNPILSAAFYQKNI